MAIVTITSDYNGKVAYSLVANRNTAKQSVVATAPLPNGAWTEYTQAQYDALKVLASTYFQLFNVTEPTIAYSLYSFDVIAKIESQYGQTLWRGKTALADKITIAKEIISQIVCTASGRQLGTLKTLYLSGFNGTAYDSPVSGNGTTQISLNKTVPSSYIDSTGYVHFLFYDQSGANQFMEIHYASTNITLNDSTVPNVPTGLIGIPEVSKVALTWNAEPQATSYNVKRSMASGGIYTTIANVTDTSYEDIMQNPLDDRVYYYVVSAVGIGGVSANSNEVVVQPTPLYEEVTVLLSKYGTLSESVRAELIAKYNRPGKNQEINYQGNLLRIKTYN